MEKVKKHTSESNHYDIAKIMKKAWTIQIVTIGLLVLNLLFSGLVLINGSNGSESIEIMKAGWPENFEKAKKLWNSDQYRTMMKSQLDSSLQQMWASNAPSQNNPTANPTQDSASTSPKWTLNQAQVQSLKKDTFIKGNPNAKITIIEYSDFQCPYCEKFHNDGVLDQIVKNYPQDANVIFKNFVVHEGAQKAAESLLCIWSLKNTDAYYDAIGKIFALSDMGIDSLDTLAQWLWIPAGSVKECLSSNRYTAKVEAEKQEWINLFNVTGTPGNVILNNESGEYVIVAGAYPYSTFEKEINTLLGK